MYDSVPWEQLGQSVAPGGGQMTLRRCGRDYVIEVNDVELMASDRHDSEESLARMACEGLKASEPRVLIGGLGMGFTLRAALDALPSGAEVVVAELVPAVVAWNRTVLGHLAKHPLHDPRVRVAEGDVARVMMESSGYHVIMLDVDNGPSAFTQDSNNGLYDSLGLETIKSRLEDCTLCPLVSPNGSLMLLLVLPVVVLEVDAMTLLAPAARAAISVGAHRKGRNQQRL